MVEGSGCSNKTKRQKKARDFFLGLTIALFLGGGGGGHRVLIGVELKKGECICPLSWSVHCNYVRDGN